MSSFNRVKALRPGRSVFNLSYQKQFDCDFGELIPVCLEEMVPGDTFKVGNEIVVRFHPLNAPVLAEINAYVHYFFVPTRLIYDKWESFITGGEDGNDATVLPRYGLPPGYTDVQGCGKYSLYDYFGFPLLNNSVPGSGTSVGDVGYYFRPLAFPWSVYNLCWNEFYRDETLQDEVDLYQPLVLNRNWNKDYFTSALPWQQRGTAPALPLSGTGSAVWDSDFLADVVQNSVGVSTSDIAQNRLISKVAITSDRNSNDITAGRGYTPVDNPQPITGYPVSANISKTSLNSNSIDMSNVATFDVSDLRLAFQVQKWMERNARSGVRYTEYLHAHYGVSPRDDRLQRPEYLGGSKSPVLVSEVVQTSESGTTPQGTLKGKGITADKNFICSYTAKEFGYLIGIMSIMPKPGYFQGVDRKWLRKSRFDFYTPEFAHLSEQAVTTEEVFAFSGVSTQSGVGNGTIFGYQARFNEMRQNHDVFCGDLRPNGTLGYWNVGRYFDSVPQLNSDFITLNAGNDHLKRIFAVQNVKGMVVNFANIITAIRPLPKYGEPGLIDHN